jgi:hypothetical protein
MKKPYKVARVSANKIKKEDYLELSEEQAGRVVESSTMRKGGYALDEEILTELLAFPISRNQRFALIALLIEVSRGLKIVMFV